MNVLKFCELCFRRPNEVGTLLISSCRHMVCRRCVTGSATACSVCQREARIIELNDATMPEQLKEYFDQSDQLTKSYKVTQFQMEKMDKFIAGKVHLLAKYEEKKKTMKKLKEHSDALKKAILEETALIRKLYERRKSPGGSRSTPSSSTSAAGGSTESLRVATLERNMQKLTVKRTRTPATSSSESDLASKSSGSKRTPVSSPDEVFKVPTYSPSLRRVPSSAELPASTRDRIYQQQVRNMDKAMSLPVGPKLKVKNRGSDIERARNMHF
ncbi:zip homologous protein 3-like [Culex quinquefasciatus]|uniref:Probable E3 SUMO-protein ligase RNF212 n=1 Tax=Culex pipiens TaxID=7175 RepID=A0A8D8FAR7_CULPI|nr:zip homologous protein 3-like [Culex quinquefasciatus]